MKLSNTTTALKPAPKKQKTAGASPIKSKNEKRTLTKDGLDTSALKSKSELFLTAISTFAGEDTYYETADARLERVIALAHKITDKDPDWMERFIPWLRGPEANIRTLSIILAAEYVAAGGPNIRKVVSSVCQRADEPAELLAYYISKYYGWDGATHPLKSPKLPAGLRKGLGDACSRLWNEYAVMKYDGKSRKVGMAEVLNLTHPTEKSYPSHWTSEQIEHQKQLFKYIIAREFDWELDLGGLPQIAANIDLRKKTREEILSSYLNTETLSSAGVTWEQLGTMLNGPWTPEAWEAIIPTMGYMALLRNLRNFEGAGISKSYQKMVIAKLTDPEAVAKSRQLPFRFLSAYMNVNSDTYTAALSEALDLSVQNIPSFDGSTLVLVDKSDSMNRAGGLNDQRGKSPAPWQIGALFGIAMFLKQENADIAIFGNTSKRIVIPKGSSVLKAMSLFEGNQGVGHGTAIWASVKKEYSAHDRVAIFTDMQSNRDRNAAVGLGSIPFIYSYDVGGYGTGHPFTGEEKGRYQFGGFSDASFKLMKLLETQSVGWPF